jgi:small-conductance mechanosensitive channel
LNWLQVVLDWLNQPILQARDWVLTPMSILTLTVLPILLILAARAFKHLVLARALKRSRLDLGIQNTITTLAYYLIIVIGFAAIFSSVGIDLTALAAFTGALGLGIGLGLQDIARNFISGLILLTSRPVKPGDRIDIEGLEGNVNHIGVYSTTILTLQDAAVIVPNSFLLQNRLINWSLTGDRRRMSVTVGVHYDADPEHVKAVLERVARQNPHVLHEPPPDARLNAFGDNSLDFELVFWSDSYRQVMTALGSEINYAIYKAFKAEGIEIPYPQRDLHVKTWEVGSIR